MMLGEYCVEKEEVLTNINAPANCLVVTDNKSKTLYTKQQGLASPVDGAMTSFECSMTANQYFWTLKRLALNSKNSTRLCAKVLNRMCWIWLMAPAQERTTETKRARILIQTCLCQSHKPKRMPMQAGHWPTKQCPT